MKTKQKPKSNVVDKLSFSYRAKRDLQKNYDAYLLVVPVIIFYLVFAYKPMYGAIIAFKEFSPARGILGSPFTKNYGMQYFIDFFSSYYFWRILKNTVVISLTQLICGFPAPIILALLINEVRSRKFARFVQTVTYMPHFISMVIICGLIIKFTLDTGIVTYFLGFFGFPQITMLTKKELFVPVYVISGIWQEVGWGSIIYLAALTAIDQELYEAARIDGANRWKQTIHITIPGITMTIVILFILRMGNVMNVGFEKIILLYNPGIYETADVISSFLYRKGLIESNFSYASAVGLFNSVINFALIISFNKLSRKFAEVSLW